MRSISFAADMGGAGFVFTGENDADIMHNSVSVNLNVLEEQRKLNETKEVNKTKIFYSDLLACIQNIINSIPITPIAVKNQHTPPTQTPNTVGKNSSVSGCISAYHRNYGIPVRVTRYHNIFGPEGTWEGGREKAPAAICRKVAYLLEQGGSIEVWGDEAYRLVPSCSLMNALKRLNS